MKIFSIIFLTTFIISCNPQSSGHLNKSTKQSVATEVRNKTIIQLRKEKNLCACGVGSQMMNQICKLKISFFYYKEIDISEARELLMFAANTFLNTINSNQEICHFSQNFPFKPKNIEVVIYIYKPNGKEPDLGNLTVISMLNGTLKYKVSNSETYGYNIADQESYEEAEYKLRIAASD